MSKVVLIKYGELTTKKDNRNFFIKTLKKNIFNKLSNYKFDIIDDYYRMFIIPKNDDIDEIVDKLSNIFGIHEIVIAYKSEDVSKENIKNISLELMKESIYKTFKVETKRSDKSYPIKSMEMNDIIGGHILKNTHFKVDVHNPDVILNIEIRREAVYIYNESIKGLGGYPVSTLGRGLLMLSGGIDSPVAGYLTIKRGVELYYLYFESRPHTSIEARNKVIELARKLEKYNSHGKLFVVNFTKIQEANDVTNFPILRPLCSFDKLDIISISKKIDTYEISILPYEDCCTVFVPRHPVINPSLKHIYSEESKFDFTELIDEAVNNIEIVDLVETRNELL